MKGLALVLAAASCAALPLAAQTPLAVGQTVTGSLGDGDPRMGDEGAHYDAYVLRGRPGERVVVRMRSDEFDTYLSYGRLGQNGEWEESQYNDDGGDGTNARMTITLSADGAYQLRAAGFSQDQVGAYELSVTAPREVPPGRIRVGQTVQGTITADDHEGAEGPEDHYLITGRRGDVVTVFAQSDSFDTYVALATDNGGELTEVNADDDGGVGTSSQMVVAFEADGEYHVIVRPFFGGQRGPYTLRVEQGAAEPVIEEEEETGEYEEGEDPEFPDASFQGETVGPVTVGRDTPGTLGGAQAENAEEAEGEEAWIVWYHDYTYRAAAGERLVIQATSDELDAYVIVGRGTGDDFEGLAEDDDSGDELNARLEFTVPAAGEYTIRVTTPAFNEGGPYVLRVDRGN